MTQFRLASLGLVVAALGFTAAAPLVGLTSVAYAAESVRAEVGGPLQAAQKLMKAGKNKEALGELRKLDNVGNKTANESFLIDSVRASAASAAGDYETAAKAFESLIASGRLSAGDKVKYTDGLVGIYMRAKDHQKAIAAINRSLAEHDDPRMRDYLIQTYYAMGNFNQASKDLQAIIHSDEKAGRTSSEDHLKLLASLQNRSGDKGGYVSTIEKLAASYPKQDYWLDLLNRVSGKPGFSGRLSVEVYRLKLATNLLKASEFLELGQLLLSEQAPAEAVKVIDKGYKLGLLGTGADAPRHQRLKDLANKNLAEANKNADTSEATFTKTKDNDGLVALGYELVQAGQADKGLKIMDAGLKADGLKHPETAKLHLGLAYAVAGKKALAISTLKTVGGTEGTADLARYWIMSINHPMN